MKAKFLKMAGVKNEKQFYAKYPTEAAFFKAHPEAKELKKARIGSYIGGELDEMSEPQSFQQYSDKTQAKLLGKSTQEVEAERLENERIRKEAAANPQQGGIGGMLGPLQQLLKVIPSGGSDFSGSEFGDIAGGGGMDVLTPGVGDLGSSVDVGSLAKKGKKISKAKEGDTLGKIAQGLPLIGDIFQGINMIKDLKQQRKETERSAKISDIALQASQTQPERTKRRYVRPEDAIISPNEAFIPGGTGTEILAEYGASIGGNPTEIQNMYNPGDLYSNLGYEPLSESDVVKQYRSGGTIPKAASGFMDFMGGAGGSAVSGLMSSMMPQQGAVGAGSKIGGSIGKGVGMIFGPAGSAIGEAAGSLLGAGTAALVDASGAKKQKRDEERFKGNVDTMVMQDSMKGALTPYSAHTKNGGEIPYAEYGWVSHDWQPQVITHFGEHSMEDLLKPPADADMLRTGGNIRQNHLSELDQFNFGGSLKTHWGGRAEVDSYNPYLPATGETLMLKGDYHSQGGIGISYGSKRHDSYTDYAEYGSKEARKKATVEAENGEPVIQLPESGMGNSIQEFALGGQQQQNNNLSMTVYGALPINKHLAELIGDSEAEGLTFKKYIARKNKEENNANKKIEKANEQLQNNKMITVSDKLKENSQKLTIKGYDDVLKTIAQQKVNAAIGQNAYNETADEFGLDPTELVKGKIIPSKDMNTAKYGIKTAQKGVSIVDYLTEQNIPSNFKSRKKLAEEKGIKNYKGTASQNMELLNKLKSSSSSNLNKQPKITDADFVTPELIGVDYKPKEKSQLELLEEQGLGPTVTASQRRNRDLDKAYDRLSESEKIKYNADVEAARKKAGEKKGKTDWLDFAKIASTQLANILRKPLQEDFRGDQLYGEMLAKSQNQLQPVQAQTFQPLLDTTFDVSFQDRLNQNQASFNALQRQLGANPAALSALAAQKYSADSQVLADQFRTNQAMRAGVFSKNRETLNDAALKNLAILDQQYVRQQKAIDNTQATDLAIANSISDKIAKNRLENRQFAAMSNMFPQYGFNRNMMAFSQSPTFFNTGMVPGLSPEDAKAFQEQYDQKNKEKKEASTTAKYGKNLKKHFKNGSIVKSLKNI